MHAVIVFEALRSHWRSVTTWCVGMLAIVGMLLAIYPTVRDSSAAMEAFIAEYPEVLRTMFNMTDYTSAPGYLSAELFSAMAPLMFIAIGIAWGASATAGEEDRGTADLLFSLPISRSSVVISKSVALVAVLAIVATALLAGLYAGRGLVDLDVAFGFLVAASLSSALLGAVFGGIAMLLGAWLGRRALALGVSITLAIAGYLLFSLAPLVDWLGDLLAFNPFAWAIGAQPLSTGWDFWALGRLILMSLVLFSASALVIRRREFSS